MRYLCVHCDHRWEESGSEPPRRCPGCMRATGIEAVSEGAKPAARGANKRRYVWLGAGAVGLALVVLLVAKRTQPGLAHELSPLAPSDLLEALRAEHVETAGLEQLFAVDAAMETRAEALADGIDGPVPRAEAVHKFMRERASKLAYVPWPLAEPRSTPVMVAKDAFALVEKDKGKARLYPLELAVVQAALLRTLDVPALVAELPDLSSEKTPLDPSGYLGYFVVAVFDGEPGQGTPHLFDPYGARSLPADAKAQVLSDKQVVGALLSLRAVYELAFHADPKAALGQSSEALSLAKNLPSVRTAHGMSVLGSTMLEQGLQELTAARQLRPDAARMHNLARVLLTSGQVESAERELSSALQKAPDFAAAHATLGSLSGLRGDADTSTRELARAEQLAPDSPLVMWARAEFLARTGDKAESLAQAERALSASPSFEAKVRFAALLRQAGDWDRMRKEAQELVAMAPEYRRNELREVLKQLLGPTAFDAVETDPSARDQAGADGQNLDLKLGDSSDKGSLHLGDPSGQGDPLILSRGPTETALTRVERRLPAQARPLTPGPAAREPGAPGARYVTGAEANG